MDKIGKIIRDLRLKAGFSQKTLAQALHITDKAISKWERGICLPDVTLLPKLSLLLDTDVDILISKSIEQEEWVGLIDISGCDFSQLVYDKPLVYYLLSHYLLLGITKIHVLTNDVNRHFLEQKLFRTLGFQFSFDSAIEQNAMTLTHPWFLFGSDLTQQFQGAMLSGRNMTLIPENQVPVFYFTHNEVKSKKYAIRTLGRGMVCLDMDNYDKVLDVAVFVRTYQKNSGLLIGSLEEIAYKRGLITNEQLLDVASKAPYGELLRKVIGKPQVDLT
ncbi:MAG TPA: helix-turn-helix domain-containing protein [Clostridiaceae bacterium]|nr:helix-turn-helix domain-containing protein [Clostridiaceae bacterium]